MKQSLLILTFLFSWAGLYAQHTVKGTVTGDNGEALIGVNILEKGTVNGTVTDLDGKYSLKASSPTATLVFSYIGYTKQEITIDARSEINIVLTEGTELKEVQVVGSRSYGRSSTESPVPPPTAFSGLVTATVLFIKVNKRELQVI